MASPLKNLISLPTTKPEYPPPSPALIDSENLTLCVNTISSFAENQKSEFSSSQLQAKNIRDKSSKNQESQIVFHAFNEAIETLTDNTKNPQSYQTLLTGCDSISSLEYVCKQEDLDEQKVLSLILHEFTFPPYFHPPQNLIELKTFRQRMHIECMETTEYAHKKIKEEFYKLMQRDNIKDLKYLLAATSAYQDLKNWKYGPKEDICNIETLESLNDLFSEREKLRMWCPSNVKRLVDFQQENKISPNCYLFFLNVIGSSHIDKAKLFEEKYMWWKAQESRYTDKELTSEFFDLTLKSYLMAAANGNTEAINWFRQQLKSSEDFSIISIVGPLILSKALPKKKDHYINLARTAFGTIPPDMKLKELIKIYSFIELCPFIETDFDAHKLLKKTITARFQKKITALYESEYSSFPEHWSNFFQISFERSSFDSLPLSLEATIEDSLIQISKHLPFQEIWRQIRINEVFTLLLKKRIYHMVTNSAKLGKLSYQYISDDTFIFKFSNDPTCNSIMFTETNYLQVLKSLFKTNKNLFISLHTKNYAKIGF